MGQTLYALLAGVSSYLPPVSKLPGAKNDLLKIQEYLQGEKKDFQDVKIKTLLDKEAVKSNIVKEFREHLGQAKKRRRRLLFLLRPRHAGSRRPGYLDLRTG